MQHNEHQAEKVKELAKQYGCEITFKLTWDRGFVSKDPAWLREVTGLKYLSIEEYENNHSGNYMASCAQLFYSPQINWDGRLLGCCESIDRDFGVNVFDVGLENALRSKRYVDTCKVLLFGTGGMDPLSPCSGCSHYQRMKKDGVSVLEALT